MVVLIAYTSAHGSTKAIARRIGERLEDYDLKTEVLAADDVGSLESYQAFVIGSAIHNSKWLSPAAHLVRDHARTLKAKPTWLFSVSSLGDTSSFFGPRMSGLMRRARGPSYKPVTELISVCSASGHRNFAGVIERDHWGAVGNLFLRAVGGLFGDHRDWADIDAWANQIGDVLRREAVPPRP